MHNDIGRIYIIKDTNFLYAMSSKALSRHVSDSQNIGQHFYASPTCCRDAQTAQHC